jgi:hypothetical protein
MDEMDTIDGMDKTSSAAKLGAAPFKAQNGGRRLRPGIEHEQEHEHDFAPLNTYCWARGHAGAINKLRVIMKEML